MNTKDLPEDPGVYLFKDRSGNIIYIGKAKNLKKRVSSYFTQPVSAKTSVLVSRIADMDFIIVDNEIEALLLENRLIKKHSPKYNIALKDSKTYAYIKITGEKFPRVMTVRKARGKGTFFGPYVSGSQRIEQTNLAVKLFKLRTCRTLPKKACLNYYIGTCCAPCIGLADRSDYEKRVKGAKKFLSGDTKPVLEQLREEMSNASKETKYEIALEKRRQIESVESYIRHQNVDRIRHFDQDVVAFSASKDSSSISMFSIKKGVILGKKEFSFSLLFEDAQQTVSSFMRLYYSQNYVPNEILLSAPVWNSQDEQRVLEKYLSKLRGSAVRIIVPSKGEKLELVMLAQKNIGSKNKDALEKMQELFNLPKTPSVIEVFDASNLGNEYLVGAMTRWVDGRPDRQGYRKFRIRSIKEQDDFASIREIIHRRYKRIIEEKGEFPDLILIDGGPGQMSAALESLKKLGLTLPIFSLAKKEEEIYTPGTDSPLVLPRNAQPLLFIRAMRDSVHNMAISYNRQKRSGWIPKSD